MVYIRIRRDTAANWIADNPILEDGEPALDETNVQIRVGDGVTPWSQLPVFVGNAPVTDPSTNRFVSAVAQQLARDLVDPSQPEWATLSSALVPQTPDGADQLHAENSLALLPWVAAASNRDTVPATVLCIGDEITEGFHIKQVMNTWPHRLASALRGALPRATGGVGTALGYFPAYDARPLAAGAFTYPVAITGTGTAPTKTSSGIGPSQGNSYTLANGGQSLTFTTPTPTTSVDIHWTAPSGATIGVSVDGAAATTYTANSSGSSQKLNIPLSRGVHTVQVQATSASTTTILGFIQHDGDETSGIRVHAVGYSGSTTTNWATPGTTANPAYTDVAPSLVVIELGVNDFLTSVPSATTQTNLGTIMSDIAGWTGTPVCFVLLVPPTPYKASPAEPWTNYVAAIKAAADARPDAAVLDLTRRIYGANTSDPQMLYYDAVSLPNDKGSAVYAQAVAAMLTEGMLNGPATVAQSAPGQFSVVPTSVVNGTLSPSGKVTCSAVSTLSINECFTSQYENYLVLIDMTLSSAAAIGGWMRANGTDDKSANYATAYLSGQGGTTVSANGSVNGTNLSWVAGSGQDIAVEIKFFSPATNRNTRTSSQSTVTAYGQIPAVGIDTTRHALNTSFDGFTIFTTGGTMSGTVRIYGYNNG